MLRTMEREAAKTVLLYQQNAYLRSASAEVTECVEVDGGHGVVLDQTVLYPEGGGQPSDHGTVAGLKVKELHRREDGAVVHVLDKAVSGRVEVSVDWVRRYDHMQQHTAQHMLTAVALDRYGLRTTAFHLSPERSDIELDTPDLEPDRMRELEGEVNALIREDRPVRIRWVERDEMESLGVRSRRLPDDLSGPVRLVEVEGVDLNTCGGTHVAGTAELQAVKLVSTEHLRGGTRVFYLAGSRVIASLDAALERDRELNRLLSCGPPQHGSVVRKMLDEAQGARKTLKHTLARLAGYLGRELAEEGGVAEHHEPGGDMAFLTALRSAVHSASPEHWLFLTAGEGSSEGKGEGFFVVGGPLEPVKAVGPAVAEVLGGRGGGPPGVFQGKATRLDRRAEALSLVKKTASE
jgi:Ser-tRNA(Ala) deacylase AlaX